MIPGDADKNQRYYHHKDFDKSHHSHPNSALDGVSTQKERNTGDKGRSAGFGCKRQDGRAEPQAFC